LSTISGKSCFLATAAIFSKSGILKPGLPIVSRKMALVFLSIKISMFSA